MSSSKLALAARYVRDRRSYKRAFLIEKRVKREALDVMERLSVDRLRADEKLIELVKGYPCLWATQSKSFRDLAAKESAWKIVSTEVG